MICRISLSRPTIGSILPVAAISVKLLPYLTNADFSDNSECSFDTNGDSCSMFSDEDSKITSRLSISLSGTILLNWLEILNKILDSSELFNKV